jgi:hypothetical protein
MPLILTDEELHVLATEFSDDFVGMLAAMGRLGFMGFDGDVWKTPDAKYNLSQFDVMKLMYEAQLSELMGSFMDSPSFQSYVGRYAQTFSVAKSGGDYTTIEEAVAAAHSVVASNNRVLINIYPGDYKEYNPLKIDDYISVCAVGRHEVTRMICNDANNHGLIMGNDTEIVGLQVQGASGSGAAGYYVPTGSGDVEFHDTKIRNCDVGWLIESAGAESVLIREALVTGGSCTSIVEAASGGIATVTGLSITDDVTTTNFVLADGANSLLRLSSCHCHGTLTTNGLYVTNTGSISATGTHIGDTVNAVRVGATAGTIIGSGLNITDSTAWDVQCQSAVGIIQIDSGRTDFTKISNPLGGNVRTSGLSAFEGDEALAVNAELIVGRHDAGREAVIGEGDSTTFGMAVLRNTNGTVGAWSNITAALASASGSTTALFAGTGVNQCVYFIAQTGAPYLWPAFSPGIKANVATAMVLGAGSVIAETWTGAAWNTINTLETAANSPYTQYGNDILTRTGSHQIRLGVHAAAPAGSVPVPVSTTLNGVTGYVWRIRITGIIGTIPILEQAKLHTNRTEMNADGFQEFFGNARQKRPILAHQRLSDDLAGASPGNGLMDFTTTIGLTAVDNRFNNNAFDGFAQVMHVNDGLDTSLPVTARIGWIPRGAGGGAVELELSWRVMTAGQAGSANGDLIDGSLLDDGLLPVVETVVAGDDDRLLETEMSGFISSAIPGNIVPWRLYRDARGPNLDDTLAASIDIAYVQIVGFFWR